MKIKPIFWRKLGAAITRRKTKEVKLPRLLTIRKTILKPSVNPLKGVKKDSVSRVRAGKRRLK